MRIASEGYPLIFTAALVAVSAFYLDWKGIALLFTAAALGITFFFRDPERHPPEGKGLVLSPADGKVVAINHGGNIHVPDFAGTQVSIFMSPLDVHVNRSPIGGKVEEKLYRPGKFRAAFRDKASADNEQNALTIVDAAGERVRVVQIAGALARRIVCYVKEGDFLDIGQKFGLIMFGSRVDLFLPPGCRVEVRHGEHVRAGETIIGRVA
jgi:phosphatidylserine decarboxylase